MKMLNLVKAEFLKQTKKLSFKVCFIILVVLAVLLPLLFKVFGGDSVTYDVYDKSDLAMYEEAIIKNPKNAGEKLRNDLNNCMIDIVNMVITKEKDNTHSEDVASLYLEYSKYKLNAIVVSYMIDNKNIDYNSIDYDFDLDVAKYKNFSADELKSLKSDYLSEADHVLKSVDDGYSDFLKNKIKSLESTKNKTDIYNANVYRKLLKLGVNNSNDFRVAEAESIINDNGQKSDIMTKSEYKMTNSSISYDNYVKLTKKKNEALDKSIEKSWYAINHNINYNKSGVRTSFTDCISNNIAFLGIIVVIIAGGIVANEFQKGTIRLLVIRPNKRWKILLSKFITVIIITLLFAVVTYCVSFVASGVFFGFKDYFISDLVYYNSGVKEVNFILHSVGKMFILLIPVIFSGLLAFGLSVVTRNTALSVGLSIFLFVGYGIIGAILTLIRFPFINYTFIPYLDYSQFISPITLVDNCFNYNTYYTFALANVVLLIWGILIYFVSNLVFIRRDIKN